MEQEAKSVEVKDTTNDDEPLFFFAPNAVHGEFSQWARSTFTVSKSEISSLVGHPVDDPSTTANTENSSGSITFSCAEQFMMFCKASRFRDYESQRRILATLDPKVQRQLGRLVTGFHDVYWDEVKSPVVFSASMAKFGQSPKLKRKLLATGDRELVEAAPRDRV